MSDPTPHPDPRAVAPRKRVVAREVTEIEAANREAARLAPDVIPTRAADHARPADPVVVIDPTTLGGRRRRSSHQRVYRWTQACALLAFLAGGISIVCTIEDLHLARALAGPAIAVGTLATYLSGRNGLARRWRGWAIASTVFAAFTLALTWLVPAMMGDDRPDFHAKPPAKPVNPAPDARQP